MNEVLINTLNSLVSNATPLVIAAMGETITERAGVINLSLNGSILLAAMVGFAAALATDTLILGLAAAMIVGAAIALIVAFSTIHLRRDQVAVGFVLTILAAKLADFLGQPLNSSSGPTFPKQSIPILREIPAVGHIFFDHNLLVYFSFILVIGCWYWLFRTRPGLAHRAIGERPAAAYARGASVNRLRYIYTAVGGGLVGLAGASYSLSIKIGWPSIISYNGDGWIALAIVIFAGWHPFRVLLGAYMLSALRAAASDIQRSSLNIPTELLNTGLPWALLIITLILVNTGQVDRLLSVLPKRMRGRFRALLRSDAPAALGERFEPD